MIRKSAVLIAILVFIIAGFTYKQASTRSNDGTKEKKTEKIQWHSFDKGVELSQKENKLLVVDFYTDWCHWCKVMEEQTYGDKGIIKYARENAIMAKLNAETEEKYKFRDAHYSGRQLSQLFGVTGFPTTVFMSPKGELITAVSGFIPPEKFIDILKYLGGNYYEKMKFDEFVKQQEKSKS